MLARTSLESLLPAVCPMIASWLCLMMANPKVPLEPTLLLIAHHNKVSFFFSGILRFIVPRKHFCLYTPACANMAAHTCIAYPFVSFPSVQWYYSFTCLFHILCILTYSFFQSGEGKRLRVGALNDPAEKAEAKYYLGGCEQYNDPCEKQSVVVRARCAAARLLGKCP